LFSTSMPGIGRCWHVIRNGVELPVGFFGRQLRGAEKNCSVSELEALAIVAAVHHFEVFSWGTDVTVIMSQTKRKAD